MNNRGRMGCGCLLFIVVVCMVVAGVFMHPFTLKLIMSQFKYGDKIFQSDVIFVPRFPEDKNGELYVDAFREYWNGNGKAIWVEDDRLLGMSVSEIVLKMAKERNIKEDVIKKIDAATDEKNRARKIKKTIEKTGVKKVIVIVPEYASRRFHLIYGSAKEDPKVLFLIKPVNISYFNKERWWRDSISRDILFNELFLLGSYYSYKFKYGDNDK